MDLAKFYPKDFSTIDLIAFKLQLNVYIANLLFRKKNLGWKGIGELTRTTIKIKKDKVYALVYLLVTLAIILLVGIAIVERIFLIMNFMKNRLQNQINDQ